MSSRICVAVRKRPIADTSRDVVEVASPKVTVNEPKIKYDLTPYTDRHTFTYDVTFAERCSNAEVYESCCLPLIDTVFSRGNATCFAYGQTGSGKTYTMLGSQSEPGLYAIAAREIFARAGQLQADVVVSFYEIYGRKIFDLLNNRERLFAREDADRVINICGLSEHPVSDIEEIFDVIHAGSAYRAAGQTSANSESSRSHAVLQIEVREGKLNPPGRRGPRAVGRISFIDLAGNERGADTFDCDRKTRMEGAEINKSLLALKECIRALGMGKSHVPFRGSILTEVLRDSFTGNSRTTMIANISPLDAHCVNTLNTLRYTQRVKDLGGGSGAAKIEQVPATPQVRRQPTAAARKRNSEAAAQALRNRPEWVSDFAEPTSGGAASSGPGGGEDDAEPKRSPRNANRRPTLQAHRRPRAVVKVKDPKIATIVQTHIAALERSSEDSDSDSTSDDGENNRKDGDRGADDAAIAAVANNILPREEERQVRKVHAYVVHEIAKAEEKLVALHRRHIDNKMTGIKEEIRAIQAFEESDSVDEYVAKVRGILQRQKDDVDQILAMLNAINRMLKDEEDLSVTLNSSSRGR